MRQFHVAFRSFRQVQDFVSAAMVKPFRVLVGNDSQQVNGKSFIGMFCLDYSQPLQVSVDCDEAAFVQFRKEVLTLLAP